MTDGKTMSGFLPFSRPAMGVEELAAVKEVLESGWITTGPKNQALEQAFCQLTGNQHAIAVSSATAGMHITLMALEIGKGDEDYAFPDLGFNPQYDFLAGCNAGNGGCRPRYADGHA